MKSLLLPLVAAVALVAPAAEARERIVPVGPDPSLGCVQKANRTSLTFKAPRGRNVRVTFPAALRRLNELRAAAPPAQRRPIAAMIRGVQRCRQGLLRPPSASRRTFAFFCLHGFTLPAVSIAGTCAIDLRGRARAAQTPQQTRQLGVLDTVLRKECKQDRGTLMGPPDIRWYLPMYVVGCRAPGVPLLAIEAERSGIQLQMEEESCERAVVFQARDFPCPPPGRPDPGPTPPVEMGEGGSGCIIVRMEEESCE